ncbi:hypothetical protein HDV04_001931 [Boothiomyces sp. JEL0838]|nr:hypothetical protein HDV04_001906 [Boothiomyces sp. JEL0838]KAJ3313502.1 hypothetical protein HDV04_001931 [Boothiomyces sp. JEL0838]
MVVKKKFIDPKNSVKFQLVHRSQRDARIADETASPYVLQPLPPSQNLLKKGIIPKFDYGHMVDEDLRDDDDDEEWEEDPEAEGELPDEEYIEQVAYDGFDKSKNDYSKKAEHDASNFGVYFRNQDEYDYLQHMKEMGTDPTAVFLAPKTGKKEANVGIKFHDKNDAESMDSKKISIPSDVFASENELDIGLLNQPANSIGMQLDVDPKIREVFNALDDEEYVENDLDDDFFDAFHEEELPEKYKDIELKSYKGYEHELYGNEDQEEWVKEFRKFQKHQEYESDDEFESDDESAITPKNYARTKGARTATTSFSMSSSAMFRNEKLTLLDDQFEKVLAEYSDDEIGELDGEDENVMGDIDALDQTIDNERLETMFDEFLENLQIIGARRTLITRRPEEALDAIRTELKEDAKKLVEKYSVVEEETEVDDSLLRLPEPKKEQWDCQSILSTSSNVYNRPKIIQEISKGVPKIKLRKGIPSVIPEHQEPESEEEEDVEYEERVNKGTSRKGESKEEKKARKAAIKQERKERRETKKATKSMFNDEKSRQYRLQPNQKLQEHSIHIQ